MRWSVTLQDGQKLIIDKGFWTGKIELRLGNAIIGRMGMKREQAFQIKTKDGTEQPLTVKHCWLDPIPQILLGGKDLMAPQRFNKWQTAILSIPALLVILCRGGAVPAIVGIGGVYLNFFIARQEHVPAPLRWTAIGIVPVVGLVFLLVVSDLVWSTQSKEKSKSGYHLKTKAPTHQYDPAEDDRDARLWAHPHGDPSEAERQRRWVEEGR